MARFHCSGRSSSTPGLRSTTPMLTSSCDPRNVQAPGSISGWFRIEKLKVGIAAGWRSWGVTDGSAWGRRSGNIEAWRAKPGLVFSRRLDGAHPSYRANRPLRQIKVKHHTSAFGEQRSPKISFNLCTPIGSMSGQYWLASQKHWRTTVGQ